MVIDRAIRKIIYELYAYVNTVIADFCILHIAKTVHIGLCHVAGFGNGAIEKSIQCAAYINILRRIVNSFIST
jgi:hypothetical protein